MVCVVCIVSGGVGCVWWCGVRVGFLWLACVCGCVFFFVICFLGHIFAKF